MPKSPDKAYVPALGYHFLTPLYDAVVGATTRERSFKEALIRQARFEPGQRVLDLASGTGTLAVWIKRHQPLLDIAGVDADPAVLDIASRKARAANVDVRFERSHSHDLPFPAAHFDRIVSSLFFHHLTWPDKLRTARELFRVLKPGGELHVADWGRPTNMVMRLLFLMIQYLDGFETTRDSVAGRLGALLEQVGFIGVGEQQTFSTIFGTMTLYSALKPAS